MQTPPPRHPGRNTRWTRGSGQEGDQAFSYYGFPIQTHGLTDCSPEYSAPARKTGYFYVTARRCASPDWRRPGPRAHLARSPVAPSPSPPPARPRHLFHLNGRGHRRSAAHDLRRRQCSALSRAPFAVICHLPLAIGFLSQQGPCAPGAARSHFGGFGVPTPTQSGASPSSSGGFFPSKGAPGASSTPSLCSVLPGDWPTTGAASLSASPVHPVCIYGIWPPAVSALA